MSNNNYDSCLDDANKTNKLFTECHLKLSHKVKKQLPWKVMHAMNNKQNQIDLKTFKYWNTLLFFHLDDILLYMQISEDSKEQKTTVCAPSPTLYRPAVIIRHGPRDSLHTFTHTNIYQTGWPRSALHIAKIKRGKNTPGSRQNYWDRGGGDCENDWVTTSPN